MIILRIRVFNLADLLTAGYNQINVYGDVSPTGSFTSQIGSIALNAGQTVYDYVDQTGGTNTWYELTNYKPGPTPAESQKTSPIQGIPNQGPLGALTPGYVRSTTEIVDLSNQMDSKISEFIIRAETLIQFWAGLHGGLSPGLPNYATILPLAARTLLEDLWLRSRPAIRARMAGGITSEKIGHYSYVAGPLQKLGSWRDYFSDEVLELLRMIIAGPYYSIHSKTTQVFVDIVPTWTPLTPNQDPNQEVKLWNDFLDIDFMPSRSHLLLGPGNMPIWSHRFDD